MRGWVPVDLRRRGDSVETRWLYVGATRFTAPFMGDTIGRCLRMPENSFGPKRVTDLDELPEIGRAVDALEPSAFVFHVSRCGSTLVTQLLGLDESCVTLSEVPFFDQLLRARFQPGLGDMVDVSTQLPAAIRIYGRRRSPTERHLIIKLDSWHIAFYSQLRSLYPCTPVILLYRDPAAVVRSHRTQPGSQAVPGVIEDAVFGFDRHPASMAAQLPRVLAFYYESLATIARSDSRALLLRYEADMLPAVESIAAFSHIGLTVAHRAAMTARADFDAKHPGDVFDDRSPTLVHDDTLQECVARYEEVDALRKVLLPASPGRG